MNYVPSKNRRCVNIAKMYVSIIIVYIITHKLSLKTVDTYFS